MSRARFLAAAVFALTFARITPSTAQPAAPSAAASPEADREATQHYLEGRRLFEKKEFAAAVDEFKASLALFASPNSELLLAHAQRELGHKLEAIEAYNHVLVDAGARVRAGEERFHATLEDAGRWAAVLRAELAEIDITLAHAAPGASVEVDGRRVEFAAGASEARAFHLPGAAHIVARAAGGREIDKDVNVAAGGTERVTLELGSDVGKTIVAPIPTPARDSGGVHAPPVPAWIAFAVGAAGFGAFAVFGSMSSSKASTLDACSPNCPASKRPIANQGQTDQTVANIALVAGGVGVATGAVLWIALPSGSASRVRAGLSPSSANVAISF